LDRLNMKIANESIKCCMKCEVEGITQRKRPGGIMLRMTWKVLDCPKG